MEEPPPIRVKLELMKEDIISFLGEGLVLLVVFLGDCNPDEDLPPEKEEVSLIIGVEFILLLLGEGIKGIVVDWVIEGLFECPGEEELFFAGSAGEAIAKSSNISFDGEATLLNTG